MHSVKAILNISGNAILIDLNLTVTIFDFGLYILVQNSSFIFHKSLSAI
jgi:hypothetical protein